MTLSSFRLRFPEFQGVPDTLVQANLDAALLEMDSDAWSTLVDEGQGLLAAHKLALSPWGANVRMVVKDGSSTYFLQYRNLCQQVGGGGMLL